MTPRKRSLRRRLTLRLLVPLLVLFGVSGLLSVWLSLYFANGVYDGWLYDSVNSLALLVDRDGNHATCDLPVAAEEIFVWDETDSTFFTVRGEKSGVLAANAILPAVPPDTTRYRDGVMYDSELNGRKIHVVSMELSAKRAGERVWVQVAETGIKRQRLARTIVLAVLAPQILLIIVALFTVNQAVKQGLSPLRRLARALESQQPTTLQPLSNQDVPEEVLPLTEAINTLLLGFRGVLGMQRKFIADTAHQLRTPLTAIKLNIHRALNEDEKTSRAILQQLQVSADRAARLVNQLLSLARLEAGSKLSPTFECVNLLELIREVGSESVPRAMRKNIELTLRQTPENALVRGDRLLLREAIDNLLDNAIKYHPGNGQVAIDICVQNHCRISVEDDGPGIAPELRTKVFERFFREDRINDAGTGLGLPIVSEIVAAHGGRIWLESGAGGVGLRAVIELPLSTSEA